MTSLGLSIIVIGLAITCVGLMFTAAKRPVVGLALTATAIVPVFGGAALTIFGGLL